eukprot:scaffold2058_cov115-Cylindrotheca_fusiformis.AAC.6
MISKAYLVLIGGIGDMVSFIVILSIVSPHKGAEGGLGGVPLIRVLETHLYHIKRYWPSPSCLAKFGKQC